MSTTGDSQSSSLPSHVKRCTKCDPTNIATAKNLIVCIDGTSNEFSRTNNTNVVEMFTQIDQETTPMKQFAYYSSGIGTDTGSSNILSRIGRGISNVIDMAFALSVKKNVLEAYAWLTSAYNEGDQIYLFGFSRGAYQVRVLASMIHEVGLLRVPTEQQITKAYNHYEAIHSGHWTARDMAKKFKNVFSWRGSRVHFVGVWDTVCSVGLSTKGNFLSAPSSTEQACHIRHALALDECRVWFMPEYFYKVNSETNDTVSNENDLFGSPDIKEVWFAGCHSDVGGRGRSAFHRAGNVSLLWMRQEVEEKGLVLRQTDVVWRPSDIDLGVKDSMSYVWRLLEYVPFVHFNGTGGNSQFGHRMQPRRIMPGQKVHASILYANTYEPKASHGEGFDVPMDHLVSLSELSNESWGTGFSYGTAAEEFVKRLRGPQGVATAYLHRLLFLLRFEGGKQSFRGMDDWEGKFMDLINSECGPLVRLGAIIAYYEVRTNSTAPHVEDLKGILDSAKEAFSSHLRRRQGSATTVLTFMRYLAKYKELRWDNLVLDVLPSIMRLFDEEFCRSGQTGLILSIMDALTCLLQYYEDDEIQESIIKALGSPGNSFYSMPFQTLRIPVKIPRGQLIAHSRSRLSKMLRILDPQVLVGALRMLKILAVLAMSTDEKTPPSKARSLCSTVKPELRRLARKDTQRIGLLSFEILLILHTPGSREKGQLDMSSANVRANMAGALAHLSADGQSRDADPTHFALRKLYGVDTPKLTEQQKGSIIELKDAAEKGNAQERTATTPVLLKLCETDHIRAFLREIKLVDVFIRQLKEKDCALLAASALVTFLGYDDMKELVEGNEFLLENIVEMLRHDYSDDAVGQADGFRTIKVLIQLARPRQKTGDHSIVEALEEKLLKGKLRETRMSLMCLEILRSLDRNDAKMLFEKSLAYLQRPGWKDQKCGLRILSALAQTEHGVAAIDKDGIRKIIQLLLPDHPSTQSTASTPIANPTIPTDQPVAMSQVPLHTSPKPASRLMGPAYALWLLALNENLRDCMRRTSEYTDLMQLCLTGTLFDERHTSRWYVYTPNQADVMDVLHKIFEVVDKNLPDDCLISIRDVILPH